MEEKNHVLRVATLGVVVFFFRGGGLEVCGLATAAPRWRVVITEALRTECGVVDTASAVVGMPRPPPVLLTLAVF